MPEYFWLGDPQNVLEISEWAPPTAGYPIATRGSAEIRHAKYSKGFYPMEGIDGYTYYHVTKRIAVTNLFIKNSVWMVDDPLHWHAMRWYIEQAQPGALLCAGLGLGLMLWHAAADSKFTSITVVERSADVIDLIAPHLPTDPRVKIVCADFYEYSAQQQPDTILWDLAVGQAKETRPAFLRAAAHMTYAFPGVPVMYFGFRDARTNSAYMSAYNDFM